MINLVIQRKSMVMVILNRTKPIKKLSYVNSYVKWVWMASISVVDSPVWVVWVVCDVNRVDLNEAMILWSVLAHVIDPHWYG
jgi:hypothetical protein